MTNSIKRWLFVVVTGISICLGCRNKDNSTKVKPNESFSYPNNRKYHVFEAFEIDFGQPLSLTNDSVFALSYSANKLKVCWFDRKNGLYSIVRSNIPSDSLAIIDDSMKKRGHYFKELKDIQSLRYSSVSDSVFRKLSSLVINVDRNKILTDKNDYVFMTNDGNTPFSKELYVFDSFNDKVDTLSLRDSIPLQAIGAFLYDFDKDGNFEVFCFCFAEHPDTFILRCFSSSGNLKKKEGY